MDEDARLSLRVGATQKDRRLDMPGRLVLTTYRKNLGRYHCHWAGGFGAPSSSMKLRQDREPETLASAQRKASRPTQTAMRRYLR